MSASEPNYIPRCVVCGKRITWQFKLCAEHEEEYGRTVEERRENGHEWLNELINDEERLRYRIKTEKHVYLNDSDFGFYTVDYESMVDARFDYVGMAIDDSNGEPLFEIMDSDFDAVFSWSL